MTRTSEAPEARIDAIMNKASRALVERRYFDAERLSVEALEAAHALRDYERMARICLPLQEARRQKRDLAADAGDVFVIEGELPKPGKIRAGCYLVRPPRVGLDGRMLREMCDAREAPAIVLVREPTTRSGTWPVVALGPVTIRAYVPPPAARAERRRGSKRSAGVSAVGAAGTAEPVPDVAWFLAASEALGDAALASLDPGRAALSRIDDILARLQTHPNHEKLHQALIAACETAARLPERERRVDPRVEAGGAIDPLDSADDEMESM
ncbi:MAG: hypothetical protein AB7K52_12050 [Phycisphaerales bacterium]